MHTILHAYQHYIIIPPPTHTHTHKHTGNKCDPDAAKEFILKMYLSVNPDPENKRIFSHFTQATDTENIKKVFQDVREHVLEENLKDYNLMWY